MKVVTWNVNSIRTRLDRLLAFLDREQPDVVCLQELKVEEEKYPRSEIADAGYTSTVLGQRTYNGVALLTRTDVTDVQRNIPGFDDDQARLIGARVGEVRYFSIYVPNGGKVGTDKWEYKLRWLKALRGYLKGLLETSDRIVLCGDYNIAPTENDVNRVEEWRGSVLFNDRCTEIFNGLIDLGLVDTLALHHSGTMPYTWWDYRMLGFPKNNGLRIDHILASAEVAEWCNTARVDREERKGKQPSDHAPVIAEFDL